MRSRCRKRRHLLAGLLIATTMCLTSTSTSTSIIDSTAVDNGGSSSSLDAIEYDDTVVHDIKASRSMESVASTIRLHRHDIQQQNYTPKNLQHYTAKNNLIKRRKAQRQQLHHRNLIVGGQAAPPGRFPYVVSLQLEKVLDPSTNDGAEVSDVHTCGGTLIAMDVVLTAGHCGYEELPSSQVTNSQGSVNTDGHVNFGEAPQQIFYGADVGAYNLTSGESPGYQVDNMLFEKLILHPNYTGFHGKGSNSKMSLQHDVMLVKLYGFSDQPTVKLHDPSKADRRYDMRQPTDGEELVVTGWGDTNPQAGKSNSQLSTILHAASVNYVPNDICEESKGYSDIIQSSSSNEFPKDRFEPQSYFEYEGTISDDMMCAFGKNEQDACQGDSGGGLLRLGDDFSGGKGESDACVFFAFCFCFVCV